MRSMENNQLHLAKQPTSNCPEDPKKSNSNMLKHSEHCILT